MKKLVFLLAVLSFVWPLPRTGEAASTIIGHGTKSCGTWTQARRSHGAIEIAVTAWMGGYLSAMNFGPAALARLDVLEGPDVEGLYSWIDNYCREHPLDTIQDAANRLFEE